MNDGRNVVYISSCMVSRLTALFAHKGGFCLIFLIRRKGFFIRHTHYLISYLICFSLIDIPWLVDFEFCLWHCSLRGVDWYLAEIVTEAWFYKCLCCCVSLHIPGMQYV